MRRRSNSDSAEPERLHPTLALQVRVGRMLGFGFALTLVWLGGAGSLAALVAGLRARKIIKQSGGEVAGMGLAWWCIVAGAVGAATMLPYTVWLVVRALRT